MKLTPKQEETMANFLREAGLIPMTDTRGQKFVELVSLAGVDRVYVQRREPDE